MSSSAAVVAPDLQPNIRGARETRAQWTETRLNFFVKVLKDHNLPRYRGQNGWVKEGWNAMAERMNEKFLSTKYVVSQLKDREQRLKKEYNAVAELLSKSGFGWDPSLKMVTTIDEKWDELSENLQKYKGKPFPYYDDLYEIYNGKVAGGKHCRRTSEKVPNKSEFVVPERTENLNTPSPTLPASGAAWADFFPDEITHSQYRAMADRDMYNCNQFAASMEALAEQEAEEAQAEKEAQAAREAEIATEAQAAKEARPKKCKRNNDSSMDELLALRREELQVYKDLTERQIQLKQRKIEKSDSNNNPFSMTKCMEKMKNFSFTQEEKIQVIKFLKEDREAREIFIGCDEIALADAYIRGSAL